ILKATNDGVWELDFKTGHAWWSDNLHAILKYPPGSITINQEFFASILHPDDKARVLSGIKSALQSSQQSWSDEYRALCCDGTYGTFYDRAFILRNEIGEPEKMIGTTLDLTGIRKFENDLAESENRLRTIVQTEPECIKITDKEGFVLEMNPAGVDMLEALGPGDVIGKNILDLISEKYKSQFLLYSQQVFEGIPFQYAFEIVSFRGNYRWVESHVVPMKNAKGEITSALAITRDISAKKKAEEELIQMNEKLRLLSAHLLRVREDERTKIAREIHDELGQQMTSLKIDLSWLRRKLSKEDDLLNEKVQGMISLIDETVKSVRRISTELRPGILDDLGLIAALEWQSQEFQKRTGIKTDFSTGISEEHCDKSTATGIFRVFQESLTNIARHSGASAVRSSLLQNNGNIILAVKDNGQGIDKKTLKSSKTLGILGMQERAMMMGGSLLIESDGGTQITLTVPVDEQTERVLS
ncbi:MAG TPA: PAS domain S-box protein, partial [Bacteroidia bacterium]|nr:PAS domain S-box protein [Bacteroidia bacterium]